MRRQEDRPPLGISSGTSQFSEEAEIDCLGAAMSSRPAAEKVTEILADTDFYLRAHRYICGSIRILLQEGKPTSAHIVANHLESKGELEGAGGLAYLVDLCSKVETVSLVEHYAAIVREKSTLRSLASLTADYNERVADGRENPSELLASLSEQVEQLQNRHQPRKIKYYTAPELAALDIPPLRWIVPDYIPQGLILVHSKPKVGKTRMTDSLGIAVAAGGRFLGKIPVNQSGVLMLYLEDTERSARARLIAACPENAFPPALTYTFDFPGVNEGGLRYIAIFLKEHPDCRLVVIDTLQMIRPDRKEGSDLYGEDVKFVRALKNLADAFNICLMVLHHSNKGGDDKDLIDAVSGTAGVSASADAIFRLKQTPGSDEAVLEGRGREVFGFELVARLDKTVGWIAEGDAKEIAKSREEREVLDVIGDGVKTPAQIAAALSASRGVIQQRLRRMAQRGVLKNYEGFYQKNPDFKFSVTDVSGISGVSAVTDVSGISGVPLTEGEFSVSGSVSGQNSHLEAESVPNGNGEYGVLPSPLMPLTSVTEICPPSTTTVDSQAQIENYHTGITDVSGISGVIEEGEDPPQVKAFRLETYRLAEQSGFPMLRVGPNICDPGEDNWKWATDRWSFDFLKGACKAFLKKNKKEKE
jgi:hypothetical protein